jgi:very-short-patch-repair endonuclease
MTSAALLAAGVAHDHQHVIDIGTRSVAVDLFFADRMLIIELDEPSLHRKPRFAAKDAERDAALARLGYTVRRVLDDRDVPAILGRVLALLV